MTNNILILCVLTLAGCSTTTTTTPVEVKIPVPVICTTPTPEKPVLGCSKSIVDIEDAAKCIAASHKLQRAYADSLKAALESCK